MVTAAGGYRAPKRYAALPKTPQTSAVMRLEDRFCVDGADVDDEARRRGSAATALRLVLATGRAGEAARVDQAGDLDEFHDCGHDLADRKLAILRVPILNSLV